MNQRGFWAIAFFIVIGIILLGSAGFFVKVKRIVNTSNPSVGVLLVTTNCMIPEGCGPKYKLFDSNFQTYMPLLGDIKESDSGLIIEVKGNKTVLPHEELYGTNYQGSMQAIQVASYSAVSEIPYRDFLVGKANEFTAQKYPCLSLVGKVDENFYNKTFSWNVDDKGPVIKVRLSGSKGYFELWYDGNSGDFIKEVVNPAGTVFCH